MMNLNVFIYLDPQSSLSFHNNLKSYSDLGSCLTSSDCHENSPCIDGTCSYICKPEKCNALMGEKCIVENNVAFCKGNRKRYDRNMTLKK